MWLATFARLLALRRTFDEFIAISAIAVAIGCSLGWR
jgi:hypothetical protein